MIKIANNLQRLVKHASAQAAGASQLIYSPELGGFHTPGTYPQSMIPEHYQNTQALNYINPSRFEEPEYFNSPEELTMALNTSGVANFVPSEQIQRELARTMPALTEKGFGQISPESEYYDFDFMRGLAAKAYQSHKRPPHAPAVMPAADIMSRDRRHLNDYEEIQREMAIRRMDPTRHPFLHAAYDVTPDNPSGITAKNPVSDAQVANLASQKVRTHIDGRNAKK